MAQSFCFFHSRRTRSNVVLGVVIISFQLLYFLISSHVTLDALEATQTSPPLTIPVVETTTTVLERNLSDNENKHHLSEAKATAMPVPVKVPTKVPTKVPMKPVHPLQTRVIMSKEIIEKAIERQKLIDQCDLSWHNNPQSNSNSNSESDSDSDSESTQDIINHFFDTKTDAPTSPSSPSHPQSKCITNKNTNAVRCYISPLYVHPEKITSALGGENLTDVMGRIEDVEFMEYKVGAFSTKDRNALPKNKLEHGWHINKILSSMTEVDDEHKDLLDLNCSNTPTLFITRYEYVNLFHTMTDWWNAFETVPLSFWTSKQKLDVVFLDGHANGNLDIVWSQQFGKAMHAKRLSETATCYNKAVLIPAGYSSAIWYNNRRWSAPHCIAQSDAFSQHMVLTYGLQDVAVIKKHVVIIDRAPYISHPRQNPNKIFRAIDNIPELKKAIESAGGTVNVVKFETMTFKQQLEAVRSADILVGAHGAGLSHVLFMNDSATLVELGSRQTNGLGMFVNFAKWRPKVRYVEVDVENMRVGKKAIDVVLGFLNGS